MLKTPPASIVPLILGLAFTLAPRAVSAPLLSGLMFAQSPVTAPSFSPPASVAKGTTVKIDGSSSLEVTNQNLKQRFEADFPGTTVQLNAQGSDAALKDLLDGKIDVAAIGRSLTPEEKAKGLVASPIRREKIAIIVGPENPFNGNLTFEQFAKIFRGEITDWSQVGGPAGPIRVIDRPELSDTRQAFKPYPVFQAAPFATGATAAPVSQDSTVDVINALGKDGIGYAIANQVMNQKSVKIIPMHKTLPDDPRYPYSQPLAYVHKGPNPSPAVQAFLGFVGAPAGQAAIQAAKAAEVAAVAAGTGAAAAPLNASPAASPSPAAVPPSPQTALAPGTGATAAPGAAGDVGLPPWLWLLPLLLGAGALWWLLKGRRAPDPGLAPNGGITIPPGAAPPVASAPMPPVLPVAESVPPVAPVTPPVTPPVAAAPSDDLAGAALTGGAALVGGAALAGAAALGRSQGEGAPLESPADLPAVADPAVFDLPESAVTVSPSGSEPMAPLSGPDLGALAGGAAVVAGAAIAGAAATRLDDSEPAPSPISADLVSLDSVETAPTVAETAIEDEGTRAQVLDLTAGGIVATPAAASPTATTSLGVSAAQMGGAFLATGAAGAAVWAARSENPPPGIPEDLAQTEVEAARFDVGSTQAPLDLSDVDSGLRDLPDGYGESRIVLLPRDPQSAYAYWDTPNDHKEQLRRQGGQQLALRLCDVTDIDIQHQPPHSMQQYDCDEMARDWHLPIPVSDRDYVAEIGYLTAEGAWLSLARSMPVRIPPVYPSDWYEEKFLTIDWQQNLRGQRFVTLIPPSQRLSQGGSTMHEQMFALAGGVELQRIAGSLFGSMQQVPLDTISSFVTPSGVGMWALPTASGLGMSGIGMSGIGFAASMPPLRARKFWLVADAELIIYGATEPDATVTIAGRPITLNPDGTFRFQMPFRDGRLDFPIWATAADGEQNRMIQMNFTRETPARRTNTKDEATDEAF
jgi:ABC-type phosphate transport system substrate-binding protein